MTVTNLMKLPITIFLADPDTPASTDEYGNPVPSVTQFDTVGYYSQSSTTEVQVPPGDIIRETLSLFVPADTQLNGWSAVGISGVAFDVIGAPWRAVNARTGKVSHVEATLEMSE